MTWTTCTPTLVRGAESEQAREIKARFAARSSGSRASRSPTGWRPRPSSSPEQLLALPEHQNQLFLPQDEWREAFKGEKRYRRQIQPERVKFLGQLDEFGLSVPTEPPADAPAPIKN